MFAPISPQSQAKKESDRWGANGWDAHQNRALKGQQIGQQRAGGSMRIIQAVILCIVLCIPIGPGEEDSSEVPEPPGWATGAWIDYAAHIVASEARNVPAADIVIACTLLRDVERGWSPWALGGRWFGYGAPDALDEAAVRNALYTRACEEVPRYKFVGNIKDVFYWRSLGMIESGPLDLYVGLTGSTVIGVQW